MVGKLLRTWNIALKRAARETGLSPVERAIKQAGEDANLVKKRLAKDRPIELFEVLYTDFTTFDFAGGHRSAKAMPMIGHVSKMILGWALGTRRNQTVACRAWTNVKDSLVRLEAEGSERLVHQDQDSVCTSNRWVDQLLEDGVRLSYSTNGAKGSSYMESFNGHFKQPIESLLIEAESLREVKQIIRRRVDKWNHVRRHSSLGQMAPRTYIENQRKES